VYSCKSATQATFSGKRHLLQASTAAVLLSALWVGPALAEGSSVLEEITVTAQKRAQNLQDVPVSVTAFSGDALQKLELTNSTDIAMQTPGLNIGTPVGEGNNPSITLRGVGLNDFNDNNESPVAVYIDDVYMASMAGQTFQLFDLERVEVLRGPQGTLYGRNSTGGLVHFISRKPTEETEGYIRASYGRFNNYKLEGAVGGALGDRVQARLSFALDKADGYVNNRIGPNPNNKDSVAWRFQLNFDATDDLSVLFNFHGTHTDARAAAYQHQGTGLAPDGSPCTDAQAAAGSCTDFFGYRDTDGDVWAGAYNRVGPLDIKTYGGSMTINWDFSDSLTLTSITAYDILRKFHQEDTDMGPLDLVRPTFQARTRQFSQETRIAGEGDSYNWVAGVYYFTQHVNAPQRLDFGMDLDPTFSLDTSVLQNTRSFAGFAQAEVDLTEQLSVTGGIRYTDEHKDYDYTQIDRLGGVTGLGIPGLVLLDFNQANFGNLAVLNNGVFSGRGGINWRPNEDWLVFASIARGFKSGGFNAGFTSAPPSGIRYGKETLTSYEVGFKSTLLGGLARFNATAFWYDYKDLIALTFEGTASFLTNAANATVKGAEFELVANPIEGMDINLGMSLLNSDADGITLPGNVPLNNRKLVLAPEFTFNGLVRYSVPMGNDGALSGQVDFAYQGAHFFDIKNQPVARENGYWVWNARVAYSFADDAYEIAAWVKNLTNEKYLAYTFDFTGDFGFNQQFYAPPRWWGVTASAKF
jgi:iron complex outermembrane receptor protein